MDCLWESRGAEFEVRREVGELHRPAVGLTTWRASLAAGVVHDIVRR